MHRPSPVSEQQLQQIRSFIHSKTRMTFQEFLSKWDVTHDFLAELFQCDKSTVNSWINGNLGDSTSQRSHQFKLFIADLIIEKYEDLPVFLQQQLCPDWNR
jgi:hypothetical protein